MLVDRPICCLTIDRLSIVLGNLTLEQFEGPQLDQRATAQCAGKDSSSLLGQAKIDELRADQPAGVDWKLPVSARALLSKLYAEDRDDFESPAELIQERLPGLLQPNR